MQHAVRYKDIRSSQGVREEATLVYISKYELCMSGES